jgi:L-alanine-DL-glutamate epimerase-like enolase superfamily enzyme
VRKEALISSQIEGTQCTLEDVLNPAIDVNANRDVADVVNYVKALNYAVARMEKLPLCNRLLREAHAAFPQAELRVDANGAFSPETAMQRLEALADAGVSCIEQPIRPGQPEQSATLCRYSPLPIALDEELINCTDFARLLDTVQPQAIVIKPSLHGGLLAAQRWAEEAEARNIRWWVNSALESHVGLTALAEWCAYAAPGRLQGLGTGRLFTDDAPGRVQLVGNSLRYQPIYH